MTEELLARSKADREELDHIGKIIAEIVERLNASIGVDLSLLLREMAERKEKPRDVLMGLTAFGAFLVAHGIASSMASGKSQEEFANFIAAKYRGWLFETIAESGNRPMTTKARKAMN